ADAALVAQYNFDESATGTGTALDTGTGTAANGSFIGSATRTGATSPGALSLGALNVDFADAAPGHYVSGGDAAKLDSLSVMTITGWLNLRSAPVTNYRIVSKLFPEGGTNFTGWDFRFNNGSGQLALSKANNAGLVAANSGQNLSIAQGWQFIAVTYDGAQAKFYNGSETAAVAQLGTAITVTLPTPADSTADFRIGGTAGATADRTPRAWFDDIRIYDTVLDSSGLAELEAIRQANIPEPACVALISTCGLLGLRRWRSNPWQR
ncbi:MAG TPA: LamG-like jellyroll fold domain-containing protein, partial [Roseimicrobium sp.]|nr:LamG-like jellyroll fold domain-containing protein [Roseimicrobium sp.]